VLEWRLLRAGSFCLRLCFSRKAGARFLQVALVTSCWSRFLARTPKTPPSTAKKTFFATTPFCFSISFLFSFDEKAIVVVVVTILASG